MSDDLLLRVPFVGRTGAQLRERRAGYSEIALEVTPDHCDSFGRLHGGIATTLMDSALAIALRELRGEGAGFHASIEMNASFLAHAEPGEAVVIEARILRVDEGLVAFGQAELLRVSNRELLATARVTFGIQSA